MMPHWLVYAQVVSLVEEPVRDRVKQHTLGALYGNPVGSWTGVCLEAWTDVQNEEPVWNRKFEEK